MSKFVLLVTDIEAKKVFSETPSHNIGIIIKDRKSQNSNFLEKKIQILGFPWCSTSEVRVFLKFPHYPQSLYWKKYDAKLLTCLAGCESCE